MASSVVPYEALFYLTANTTRISANETLLRRNTLVFNHGYSIVNQTTLMAGWNQDSDLNITVLEDVWYNLSTTIAAEGYAVAVNDFQIALIPIKTALLYIGTGSLYVST